MMTGEAAAICWRSGVPSGEWTSGSLAPCTTVQSLLGVPGSRIRQNSGALCVARRSDRSPGDFRYIGRLRSTTLGRATGTTCAAWLAGDARHAVRPGLMTIHVHLVAAPGRQDTLWPRLSVEPFAPGHALDSRSPIAHDGGGGTGCTVETACGPTSPGHPRPDRQARPSSARCGLASARIRHVWVAVGRVAASVRSVPSRVANWT